MFEANSTCLNFLESFLFLHETSLDRLKKIEPKDCFHLWTAGDIKKVDVSTYKNPGRKENLELSYKKNLLHRYLIIQDSDFHQPQNV